MSGRWASPLSARLSNLPRRPLYVSKIREMTLATKGALKMTSGEPDFPTPAHIKEAAKKALDDGYTYYTSSAGLPEFVDSVVAHHREGGVDLKRGQVLVTAGAIEGLFLAMVGILEKGDQCIIPDPGYIAYEALVGFAEAEAVPVGVDRSTFNLTAEAIEKKVTRKTKLVVLNSPSNPTGGVIPPGELKNIVELCKERRFAILSDEAYEKIVYDGRVAQSLLDYPEISDRVIVAKSLSKTYSMTGWRVGYLLGDEKLVRPLTSLQAYVVLAVSAMAQKAGAAALGGPQDSVKTMVDEFHRRRELIVSRLNAIPGVKCPVPAGAFYAFPDVEEFGMGSFEMSEHLLKEGKVGVYPGVGFGRRGEGRIRLSFATSRENIEEAARRIGGALKKLSGGRAK
ncbi:MAG: pyridoxal phosphate-dependent aminotransferase [Thaumarchaeota archaeon]|nr:pyridoxal phosphate-dependent aminotransferase [Nitrososphaerota archaeon]